jgi:hypothetical protein
MWRQIGLPGFAVALAALFAGLFFGSQVRSSDTVHSSAAERLQPVEAGTSPTGAGATVYVPVYSSLYLGLDIKQPMIDLAATVSVRNVSTVHPIVIESVRYYDSTGKRIRDYVDKEAALPPLASVEFVIQRADATGGPGANFLIHWKGPANVDAPIIEAVMLGKSGSGGVSFTSAGRTLKAEPGIR